MPNQEHLAILMQGIDIWNDWRKNNPHIIPNLEKANLRKINLSWVVLIVDPEGNILKGAEARIALWDENSKCKTYCIEADLRDVIFRGADLREANFMGANLSKIQALGTNFAGAKLTGACLEDWHINSATNLNGVICDYVYLREKEQERRPSSGDFAQGEFTKLFQKSLETVDLLFRNGIDWDAFSYTFNKI